MGWADNYIEKLKKDEIVHFRPRGDSMKPLIKSNQLVCVKPVKSFIELKKRDVVLCKIKGNQYLHLIKKIRSNQFQIGNNKGGINGWISFDSIYGKYIPKRIRQKDLFQYLKANDVDKANIIYSSIIRFCNKWDIPIPNCCVGEKKNGQNENVLVSWKTNDYSKNSGYFFRNRI